MIVITVDAFFRHQLKRDTWPRTLSGLALNHGSEKVLNDDDGDES